MSEVHKESRNVACFLCDHFFMKDEKSWLIFDKSWLTFNGIYLKENQTKTTLSEILSNVIGCTIDAVSAHSTLLCTKCKTLTLEYKSIEQKFNKLRNDIVTAFNQTLEIYRLTPIVNIKIEAQETLDGFHNNIEQNENSHENLENTKKIIFPNVTELDNEHFQYRNDDELVNRNIETAMKPHHNELDPLSSSVLPNDTLNIKTDEINICVEEGIGSTWDANEFSSGSDTEILNEKQSNQNKKFSIENLELTLETHENTQSPVEIAGKFKCKICNEILANKWSLNKHTVTQHNRYIVRQLKCKICNKLMAHKKIQNKNIKTHSSELERRFDCNSCTYRFFSTFELKRHKMMRSITQQKKVKSAVEKSKYLCDICNKQFLSEISMEKHKKSHDERHSIHHGNFKCQFCNKKFISKRYYKIHIQNHKKSDHHNNESTKIEDSASVAATDVKGYQCDECDKLFSNEKKFNTHMEYHKDISERKRHACKLCDKTYFSRIGLQTHEKNEHGAITTYFVKSPAKEIEYDNNTLKNVYKCEECQKLFASEITLKHHMETHRRINENQLNEKQNEISTDKINDDTAVTETAHKCDKCSKIFATFNSLKYHMEIHSEVLYECEICKVNFSHKRNLANHKNFHIKERQPAFECNVCHKKFSNKGKLQQHQEVHSSRYYPCDDCGKVYSQLRYLKKHKKEKIQKLILGRNLFQCTICHNKSFASRNALREHQGTHVDASEYQFQCENCEKKFYTKTELKRHELKHTNNLGLECDICQKKFLQKFHLELHKSAIHMGIKNYLCDICGKSFAYPGSLECHYAVHSNEYPFDCTICKRPFKSKSRLATHVGRAHRKSNTKRKINENCDITVNGK